ncbi:hypothetical protein GCM10010233_61840 [Streptomyces pseudogriseolus]|uniref:Uncharacterized protein n=1 Tax=Streptomyces pseudogriseolus TaxID=36817 RepID=A0ABQ2TLI5_STREZ|nr:hypothetical protein GCM10010233_61840 [Streptomyces gancidicus]GGS74040.1 hypothetical protein GCM10010285_61020 [Streptomyces rubiginosus]
MIEGWDWVGDQLPAVRRGPRASDRGGRRTRRMEAPGSTRWPAPPVLPWESGPAVVEAGYQA